jgi:peptidoglycan hydrolase-like protein with peptidoglycan-binding domain
MTNEEAPVGETATNTEKSKPGVKTPPEIKPYHVVSGREVDNVHLSKFKPDVKQKSLSIHQAQRRLSELGFNGVDASIDGRFDKHTQAALAEFQTSVGYEATGLMDDHTLASLFDGDPNVKVCYD